MSMFRKKPVVVEARQFFGGGNVAQAHSIYQWIEKNTLGSFEPLDVIEGDKRPHSRACGIRKHDHGPECSRNCPTCDGQP
jgi:hypothetical protein